MEFYNAPFEAVAVDYTGRQARPRLGQLPYFMLLILCLLSQKTTFASNDVRNAVIYFAFCWSIWFLQWSSRVWASRSWEYGLPGLLGTNRLSWDNQVAVVTGGEQTPCPMPEPLSDYKILQAGKA